LLYQQHYIEHHRPLIQAGLAAAEQEGNALFENIGAPPGATPLSAVEKKVQSGGSRGMWRGTPCSVSWSRTWDIPGNHPEMLAWYEKHLLADGWKLYVQRIPSNLKTLYWKGNWLFTLGHNVSFPTDRPPHARLQLRLDWDYWYRLEETSAEHAGK